MSMNIERMILTESTITIISLIIIILEILKAGVEKSATATRWKNIILRKVRPPKENDEKEEDKLIDITLD